MGHENPNDYLAGYASSRSDLPRHIPGWYEVWANQAERVAGLL